MPIPALALPILEVGLKLADRLLPDPEAKAAHVLKLQELAQSGTLDQLKMEVDLLLNQLEINKLEAQHPNFFIAGWRPAIGWVCVAGLAMKHVIYPVLRVWWPELQLDLDLTDLLALLIPMLGIAGLRSWDKYQEVDTKVTRDRKKETKK